MVDTLNFDELIQRLSRIESALEELLLQRTVKEWYTVSEIAKILDRSEYTVREWCRLGRAKGRKKPCGRGKGGEWLVSHAELMRLRNEGLLPFQRTA
jgi:DNA-directed RNA polymerase specialized sigma24 family protein